ncbi:YqcC family protein [Arsukibacterium sp.]|uniref:YqcC family protein n=1 Tax=Arsukibacterium sp. TaxID=1977258 RepID=UPI001BD4C88B|nr:YqcC family protein [Arsukibacterium sp.]
MSDTVKALLNQLETELKQQQLWSAEPPCDSALASNLPFCCDTLRLEQWLQFVFLPKLRQLLQSRQPLPAKVSVLPYAEEAFKGEGASIEPLLLLIKRLDITLTDAL